MRLGELTARERQRGEPKNHETYNEEFLPDKHKRTGRRCIASGAVVEHRL